MFSHEYDCQIIYDLEQKLIKHEKIAQAAIKLFTPPYNRGTGIIIPHQGEDLDFENLRQTLLDAGYGWEEYT